MFFLFPETFFALRKFRLVSDLGRQRRALGLLQDHAAACEAIGVGGTLSGHREMGYPMENLLGEVDDIPISGDFMENLLGEVDDIPMEKKQILGESKLMIVNFV